MTEMKLTILAGTMFTKSLILAIALVMCQQVQSQTLVVHLHTWHFNKSVPNNNTPGVGIKFSDINESGAIVGMYTNSYFKRTYYAGYAIEDRNYGLMLGLANGYKNLSPSGVVLMVVPSYAIRTELGNIRISSPNLQGFHFNMEF